MKKVAVTGGISCGKSTVCRIFKELGAVVVSSDAFVHQLLSPNTKFGKQVIDLLGPDIVVENQIDRKRIAEIVFADKTLLHKLEAILHPAVQNEIDSLFNKACKEANATLFVAEVPLLFETGSEKFYDASIAVIATDEMCKKRFLESSCYSVDEFERRSKNQLKNEDKAAKADFVIKNDGNLKSLEEQVEKLFNQLK